MDYDVVYLSSPDTLLIWNSVGYTSLPALRSASGQEMHGIQADPKCVNAAGGDLHLPRDRRRSTPPTPARAVSRPPTRTATRAWMTPGSANTGAGPRAYDDRGAYEYQAAAVDHIVISPPAPTIVAGGSQAYTAQGFDAGGN